METMVLTGEEAAKYEEELGLKEKHRKLMHILTAFDSFCRSHGIQYSLADGTLIGAVRHQGFIPWDDDADLLMTRTEYNKLREAIRNEKEILLFKIGCLDRMTLSEYLDEHLYVDLFLIDEVPASGMKYRTLRMKCGLLRSYFLNIYQLGNSSHQGKLRKIIEPVMYRLARIYVGKRDVFDLYDALFAKSVAHEAYTKFTSTMQSMKHRYPNKAFDEGYVDTLFSDRKLMMIRNADIFLKELYGDYMKLPPKEKWVPEHGIDMLNAPADCIKWYNK